MEGRKRNPVFPAPEALAPAAGPKRAPGINEKAGPGTDSEMIEKAGPEKAPAAGKAGPEGVPPGNPSEGSKRENKNRGGVASPFPRSAAAFPGKVKSRAAL